jgi:subtilisin family serine protease
MASPVVGGTVALWLQANPTLTPAQVMEIISKTSRHTEPSIDYPNNYYGYGEIDVYSGLVEALKMQGLSVEGLSHHQPQAVDFLLDGRDVVITFAAPTASVSTIYVYALNGTLLATETLPAYQTTCRLSLQSLPADVYALQINSSDAAVCGSTLVRIQ